MLSVVDVPLLDSDYVCNVKITKIMIFTDLQLHWVHVQWNWWTVPFSVAARVLNYVVFKFVEIFLVV